MQVKSLIQKLLKNRERNYLLFSQILGAFIGIVYGKLVAVYIPISDFGVFNLYYGIYFFFFSVFFNPLLQFIKVNNTNLQLIGHRNILKIFVVFLIVNALILYLVFKIKYNISPFLVILINLFLVSNFLFNLYTDYFNLNNKIKLFSTANILKNIFLLTSLGFFIFFGNKVLNGLEILWITQLFGFVGVIICFLKKYKWYFNNHIESFKEFFRKFFLYSSPLIILAFWSWVNTYTDRYIIEYFLDEKSVGLYNANLGLGSKFFLLFYPFFTTLLTPIIFNKEINTIEKKKVINKYAKVYGAVAVLFLIFVLVFLQFIGNIFLSAQYKEGFFIIFWGALGYFLLTLGYFFEMIFYANHQTKMILYANIVSGVLSIVFNIIFINIFGLKGILLGFILAVVSKLYFLYINYKKL